MIVDFRLKVFQTVAQELSFTAAARQLFISQPAVTRHINELEKAIEKPLFHRHGNRISLTREGQLLYAYGQQIMALYSRLDEALSSMQDTLSGQLNLGASTTIAQYILPVILAQFKQAHPGTLLQLQNANTRTIEQLVSDQKIDLGIIEGEALNPLLHYEPFTADEIVLVCRTDNGRIKKAFTDSAHLRKLPLVLREPGSGTRQVVLHALRQQGLSERDLKIEMELGSSESVKNYLMHADAFAFLSIHTIRAELAAGHLKVIDLTDLEITRTFHFVSLHGQYSPVLSRFKAFCQLHYRPTP